MARKYYETDEFKALKAEWEQKLADSGFKDVEYQVNGEPADYMVGPNPMDFIRRGKLQIDQAVDYYEAARAWRWHLRERGERRVRYRIWDMHAEGVSQREISETLGVGTGVVARVLRELREQMQTALREQTGPWSISP